MRIWGACILLLLLAACAQSGVVCTEPYMKNGNTCCLDRDSTGICDADEGALQEGRLDCSLCPPQFVTQKEPVFVYRYVCANQSIMDTADECGARIVSNAHLYSPYKEQDGVFIDKFTVSEACRGKFQAAELHLVYERIPLNITLQVQDDPEGSFENAGMIAPGPDIYYYIGFCRDCQQLTNIQLDPTRAYMVRAVLQYPERKVYTREYVIDPTPDGAIGKKLC